MSKKQQTITVSFSKRNMDLYNFLLENKSKEEFSQNEFIINAMRFYIEHKDYNFSGFNLDQVNALISKRLIEFKETLNLTEISLDVDTFDEDIQEDINIDED